MLRCFQRGTKPGLFMNISAAIANVQARGKMSSLSPRAPRLASSEFAMAFMNSPGLGWSRERREFIQ